MRRLSLLLGPALVIVLLSILCVVSLAVPPQNEGRSAARRPLDLPSGGRGDKEDAEDAPEIITFYGNEYEGDAFFWCLDKSGSMVGTKILVMREEVIQAINLLSQRAEFGLVAFSTDTIVWSTMPIKATAAAKQSAIAWVQMLNANGMTCIAPAGVTTIGISNQSNKSHKQMIFVSDGIPYCSGGPGYAEEALQVITETNWQRTPINTLFISGDNGGQGYGEQFMQTLAAMNNGTFYLPDTY